MRGMFVLGTIGVLTRFFVIPRTLGDMLTQVGKQLKVLDMSFCSALNDAALEHLVHTPQLLHLGLDNCRRMTTTGNTCSPYSAT
jgi:hypothetical protein